MNIGKRPAKTHTADIMGAVVGSTRIVAIPRAVEAE
jgi:hypothetical protein